MGVVNHRNWPKKPLSERTSSSRSLGHMQFLLRSLETRISFTHVYGHMDKFLKWDNMTREQQLTVTIDTEEGEALEKVIEIKEYITSYILHQRLVME